ncbi:MAG: divergent PAP2 family protein [Oscillospiraceae bacterium]|nr:divergent PAP2 family protein [Oscillospiraceae bacterium]
MNFITTIFQNKYITVPALAWFIAQSAKLVYSLIKFKKLDFRLLYGTGGMPSSHTGYVVSLCTVIGKSTGVDSAAFGLSFAFALVVMIDAAGVRQAAGKHARLLNTLMSTHFPGDAFNERLKELIGHKPLEVLIGAILGVLTGALLG